jgi:hypothetical protein
MSVESHQIFSIKPAPLPELRRARWKAALLSKENPTDVDFAPDIKTEIAKRQMEDHLQGREIACAMCRWERPMHTFYRCRYCGVWYCHSCALAHFGPTHSP